MVCPRSIPTAPDEVVLVVAQALTRRLKASAQTKRFIAESGMRKLREQSAAPSDQQQAAGRRHAGDGEGPRRPDALPQRTGAGRAGCTSRPVGETGIECLSAHMAAADEPSVDQG